MTNNEYILTLSCNDKPGIVAAVSNFLYQNGSNIIESKQFGDSCTNSFFMRNHFSDSEIFSSQKVIEDGFSLIAKKYDMKWNISNVSYKPKVLIMVSKEGHCLNQILHRYQTGKIPMDIVAVVSNHRDLEETVKWHNIDFYHMPITKDTKIEQEGKLIQLIDDLNVDVVALARYMQILSENLCNKLEGKAINIHHSFLPSFKGANPYKQAHDRGVKIIGATAHYVTADLDEGPIIEQEILRVNHGHSAKDLKQMGEDIESQVLTRALRYHIEQRVILNGTKTVVF